MRPDLIDSKNLDANETAHFEQELRFVKTQTYDRLYPDFGLFGGNFPLSYEVPAHARTIEVRSFDVTGIAKIISDFSDDLPRADIIATSDEVKVRTIADSFGYSIDEIRASSATKSRLDARKADAAKRAIFSKMNDIAFRAMVDTHAGMRGLLYTPGIPVSLFANNLAGTSKKWADKTPNEILKDLNAMVQAQVKTTKGVERPDTIYLPTLSYGIISTTPRSDNSDTTIMEFFLKTNPFIKKISLLVELDDVTPRPSGLGGLGGVAICFKNDKMKLAYEITSQFEQLPAQEKGLEFIVPCMAKTAGFCVYYPLSIGIWEGLE